MIEDDKLNYDFSECSSRDREILEKYWDSDSEGNFPHTLKQICEDYDLKQNQLYNLASKHFLTWNFGMCDCGEPIIARIDRRYELISCLKGYGTIGTIRSVKYFNKCKKCNDIQEQKEFQEQFENNDFGFNYSQQSNQIDKEQLSKSIKCLTPFEIKLLYQIYKIRDFNLIKNSTEIFPVKYGEHKNFVWRTLYKFDNIGLINAYKTGSFINDVEFLESVSTMLDHMIGELEPLLEQSDVELSLLRVTESNKVKYFSILEPETDIILKAGHKYEFVATMTTDKNILLRVINIHSIKTTMDSDDNDNKTSYDFTDLPPF